jgi:NADPH-dependent 2,4-dienoyl-CoA reductase/sulfur reductase-like enzyme
MSKLTLCFICPRTPRHGLLALWFWQDIFARVRDTAMKDVAIIGAGIAGMAIAALAQRQSFSTIVFEAHGQPGGCAGFYRRRGFAFDVGATTLVDCAPGGVGDEWLASIILS